MSVEGLRLLFLIRHGRSDFDSTAMVETVRGRQWDPPLGDEGRLQAQLLGRRLALMPPPAAVYCSTFRRARETIAPFAQATGCKVTYLEELGEAFIGGWEGMSFEEIVRDDAEMLQLFRDQEAMWRRAPGAERLSDLQERSNSAIEAILDRHRRGNVVVVAHGGVINAYIAPILGLHDREMFFLPDNTSINTIVVDGDRRELRFLSDIRHLNEPHFFEPEPERPGGSAPNAPAAGPILARSRRREESRMSVKFLSEEWADALKAALNQDEAFRAAAGSVSARVQQVITEDGQETRYWIVIADGAIDMGIGDLDPVDATITQSYDTAAALSKGELNAVTAFMTGKIKVAGNMGLLLGLQGALTRLPSAMSSIQTEY